MQKINFINNTSPLLSAENLNAIQTNTENAINEIQTNLLKVYSVSFSVTINGNTNKYDQTYSITTTDIPNTYKPIGVVGESKTGSYYSHCPFTRLYVGGANNRTLYWAMKNTSSSNATLYCTIYILAIKIST